MSNTSYADLIVKPKASTLPARKVPCGKVSTRQSKPKISEGPAAYQLSATTKQRAKLDRYPLKTRLKLIGNIRSPLDGLPTFEIERVVKLKSPDVKNLQATETEEDWD
jgi:hypothetical protein